MTGACEAVGITFLTDLLLGGRQRIVMVLPLTSVLSRFRLVVSDLPKTGSNRIVSDSCQVSSSID